MSIAAAERKMRVDRLMRDDRMDVRSRKINVWNFFLTVELQSGTQFVCAVPGGQLYMILGLDNQVLSLPTHGGDEFFAYLHEWYGLARSESYAKLLYETLRAYVGRHGSKTELRRFAVFKTATQTTYISAYNGRMYKIDGSTITDEPMGEDGVFFANDDNGFHCSPDVQNHGILIPRVTDINFAPSGLSGISPEQQKRALVIWMFALAFPDLMPTKPVLLVEGVKGSGKTSCAAQLQLILFGHDRRLITRKSKEDDFGVTLLRSPIALLDNLDTYIDWIPDAVAAYTTGGEWSSRKLYTDDEHLIIKPHAFLAVTTRNPASFRRDDVADRCLILRLERRKSFTPEARRKREILDDRPRLLGEYLWYVGQIIEELRRDNDLDMSESERMADFAALGRVVGRVLGWESNSIDELMQALQGERDAFINEDDPLIELVNRWLVYKPQGRPGNIGRLISVTQMHAELETLAQAAQIEWRDSSRTLASKIKSSLDRAFRIKATTIAGQPQYQFWRHTDAQLEVVSDDDDDIMKVPP